MTFRHLSIDYLLGMGVWLAVGVVALVVLLKLRRRWKSRPKLRWLAHAGLSMWMLLFLLTLVELYFATVYDRSDSFNMTNVSKKWFSLHVEPDQKLLTFSDGRGLKYRDDREFPRSVPNDKRHICFLGDSFTFGHGVPDVRDRFSNRVRAELESKSPGRFVVSNLADAGTDLFWVEAVLKKLFAEGPRIDTVVYVMCLNDIETFAPDPNAFYTDLGDLSPRFFLFRDTYFLNFIYFRYKQYTRPAVKSYYSFVREFYDGRPWERMRRKLLAVREMCRRKGTDFRVVVFPFLHNLGPDYEFRPVHGKVVSFCKSHEIPVLDLDPLLTPHVDDGLTVNRFDAHPNERAHELAAEAILGQMTKE